ncbi:uncharacterized protein B0H64DRAFT_416719 [Chaetomium fimeti]|uniref:Zn(2)-C6 fungal-type domain-containing protein n=1 Tax=Chaetomium fimeti TaxID=1854472 RepID=A0AAE0HJV0_9PEZI|nr:hypothetical protein B0H64DRAFT_416719 [Chaetomium fimeti]
MEPERRRRRPAVSCILCRRRKIRCDRQTPCSNCIKSKNATCSYRDDPRPPRRQSPLVGTAQANRLEAAPTSALLTPSTGALSTEPNHVESLNAEPSRPTRSAPVTSSTKYTVCDRAFGSSHANRDNHATDPRLTGGQTVPEQAMSANTSSANTPVSTFTKNSRVETKTINFAGNFYFHSEHRLASHPRAVTRSLNDMFDIIESHLRDDNASKALKIEKRCKALGRLIKSRRSPPWPCPPTPHLPVRTVADALVECYLSSSETVLRVLHIPSFRRDYEAVWDPSNTPDPAFLVQLKLVMAIGATTYDDTFSLRPCAMKWAYEGQTWLSAPEFKSRLGLPALQSSILLLLAREATGVGEDMVWATVGTTLRLAMYMGLHRDPEGLGPKTTTPLVAEMRRRLWNTVLELALQSSLNSGGPPMINLDEFDTEPPGNFDDDQLPGQEGEAPVPRPSGQFTQTTMAISLRSLFPQRLAIVKCLNDLSSTGSYTDTLKLDAELREGYKTLTRSLQACRGPEKGPSDLELRVVDLLLRRYFLALHLPFFACALQETMFTFSRRVVVESALRLWRAVFPVPLSMSADANTDWDPLQRIAISGSGFFRIVAIQGFVAIAIELKSLLKEEESFGLGPVELRPDLVAMVQDYKVWSWRSMETGETNTKGYLVACMIYAQVDAMRRGMSDEDTVAYVVKSAEDSEEECLALFEQIDASTRETHEAGLDSSPEFSMGAATPTSAPLPPAPTPPHQTPQSQPQPPAAPTLLPVTPLFPPGDNVIFAHSSFFSRFTPAGTYPELPTPARVREQAVRLGLVSQNGDGDGAEGGARMVPFPELGLLVKYGREVVGAGNGGFVGGVAAAEGKAMSLARRTLVDLGMPAGLVPVPEVFGWRRDAESGERFVYMDLPEGEVLEDRWAGLSEVEREAVCTQLRDVVGEWRRLRLGGVGFVGSVDNGPLQDEVFHRCALAGAPPAGPFPTVTAFHDYFVAMAVTVSRNRHAGAGDGQLRYTPHHLFPDDVPVVFTHGSLHPRNIIVSSGPKPRVVSILGWEQAGWCPAYWELCKARAECSRRGRLGGWESKYLSWVLDTDGLNAAMGGWNVTALCQYWDYFVGLM